MSGDSALELFLLSREKPQVTEFFRRRHRLEYLGSFPYWIFLSTTKPRSKMDFYGRTEDGGTLQLGVSKNPQSIIITYNTGEEVALTHGLYKKVKKAHIGLSDFARDILAHSEGDPVYITALRNTFDTPQWAKYTVEFMKFLQQYYGGVIIDDNMELVDPDSAR